MSKLIYASSTRPPVIALEQLLDRVGHDYELLDELYGIFAEDIPQSLASLHTHATGQNLSEIKKLAHTIKGMCGNIGAARAAEEARNLELHAQAAELVACSASIRSLDERVTEFLAEWKAVFSKIKPGHVKER